MARPLPLSTLLSQALIAFTIEFDNEFERRAPHSTTLGQGAGAPARGGGPWLVSQAMWTLFIRHVRPHGTPVRELQALACLSEPSIKSKLNHLQWWHYLTLQPPPDGPAKPRARDMLVRLTPGGERARAEWEPLAGEIEKRWRRRFGAGTLDPLKRSLGTIVGAVGGDLPDSLPIADYSDGMRATLVFPDTAPPRTPVARLDVSALLARALLAMTLEYERASEVSLPIAANVLRVVEDGPAIKEVAARAGVSKEGVNAAMTFLQKKGYASTGDAKSVRLSAKGREAQKSYARTLARVEKIWTKRFGSAMEDVRSVLDALTEPGRDGVPRLGAGLRPAEGGWRAEKPYAERTESFVRDPRGSLPHHPMVLHRGGFPDGS